MRPIATAFFAILLVSATSSFALPISEGRIVRGAYTASGQFSTADITVQYQPGTVSVNSNGRIRGHLTRVVTASGRVIQAGPVTVTGRCRSLTLRVKKGTFTAPAIIKLSDGATFRGEFNGLSDHSQRVSRYFRGKINGNKHSNLLLRSR